MTRRKQPQVSVSAPGTTETKLGKPEMTEEELLAELEAEESGAVENTPDPSADKIESGPEAEESGAVDALESVFGEMVEAEVLAPNRYFNFGKKSEKLIRGKVYKLPKKLVDAKPLSFKRVVRA